MQGATKPAKSAEIFFDFGKHDLRPEADSVIGKMVAFTKNKDNFTVKITAHTDSIGSITNNEGLSLRRANSVKQLLVAKGIAEDRISYAFLGEKMPVTSNASEMGRQQNRRATVEVFLAQQMVTISGTVVDEKTGKPLISDIVLRTKDVSDTIKTGADGRFETMVAPGTILGIDAYSECHFMKSEMIKALPKSPPVSLPLRPTEKGAMADIDNLYFVGNQAILLENSKPVLPKILRFMQLNPQMKIEIAGHINLPNSAPVKDNSDYFLLSQKRAQVVYDYLSENGIPSDRIQWKGYGNWEMRLPYATKEEDQAKNRRVEIRVLENGCE